MTTRLAGFIVVALVCLGCETTITSPTATATPIDVNAFNSRVLPGGSASREFTLTTGGSVGVTLTSTTPTDVMLGVGLGIPRSDGSCALSGSVATTAGAGPQLAMNADTGSFCVKAYDPGRLPAPVAFTLVISRP